MVENTDVTIQEQNFLIICNVVDSNLLSSRCVFKVFLDIFQFSQFLYFNLIFFSQTKYLLETNYNPKFQNLQLCYYYFRLY